MLFQKVITGIFLAPAVVDAAVNGSFTLTSYKPGDSKWSDLKANYGGGLNLFQEKVRSYCPSIVGASCPNGTETVWYNGLYPSAMVPGGQDSYVLASGLVLITTQHSHSIPNGAYWGYEGWNCNTGLMARQTTNSTACSVEDPLKNCATPTGICKWKLPNSDGGIYVCANPYNPAISSIFVKTPGFDQVGCVELEGLAVHMYQGSIPVWSYI